MEKYTYKICYFRTFKLKTNSESLDSWVVKVNNSCAAKVIGRFFVLELKKLNSTGKKKDKKNVLLTKRTNQLKKINPHFGFIRKETFGYISQDDMFKCSVYTFDDLASRRTVLLR